MTRTTPGNAFRRVIDVTGSNPYKVVIGHDLTEEIAGAIAATRAAKVVIICQPELVAYGRKLKEMVAGRGLDTFVHEIPSGEAGKSLAIAEQCWDVLGELTFGRQDLIVGLGGGAATDLAGFVAATWMRGVRVIQVPTTLLAMVDAAVGGKTGINTAVGKNLVGSFHEPTAVFVDLDVLATLPPIELVAGSAEIIKTGFIADPVIVERYEEDPAACLSLTGYLPELVARSVAVKAAVVSEDLKEAGLREILNYGHTFGHAVELYENFQWRHGNAVAVSMMFIAHLSAVRGLIDEEMVARHERILTSIGLPTTYQGAQFAQVYEGMTRDKKNREGKIRFVTVPAVGKTGRLEDATIDELQAAYARMGKDTK